MNTSQIRFAQPVNGRQQQIIANSSVVQQPTAAATPPSTILVRHPLSHTTPNAVSVHGTTGVRSLVVSQPSNRPIAANVPGSVGSNVQMYVAAAQQPVSILPRGGLRTTAPSSMTAVASQPMPSAVTVQAAHASPGATMLRPKMENLPTTTVSLTTTNQRSQTVHGSDDPSVLAQVNKCHHFLSCLIRFSDSVEKRKNLTSIMQELIDAKISVLEFMDRVTDCLKSNTQLPQLRPFLEMVLPHLRREMYAGKLSFEGNELRAPPLSALQGRSQPAVQQPQIATTSVPRHQHPTQMAQVIQTAPTAVQNVGGIRQPVNTVAIHTTPTTNHHLTVNAQRAPAPGVTGPRAIAMAGANQGLRALHPRPSPIISTVNSTPPQHTCGAKSVNVVTHGPSPATISAAPSSQMKRITPRTQQASTVEDYEEYNDVAMMGGVNLTEESRNILPTVSAPATATSRSCKEQMLVPISTLRSHMMKYARGVSTISDDAVALLSHALEERLKNMFTHLSMAVEHRTTQYRECPLFEQDTDVRGQIKFLEEIDRAEKVRHDDEERAALIKAARSRSRNENMDHIKMKEKARLMMQKEYEMEKQREANITALAAIGSRKKRKLDTDFAQLSNEVGSTRAAGNSGYSPGLGSGGKADGTPAKRIIRRATMKDLVYVMERDPNLKRSQLMWKASFK